MLLWFMILLQFFFCYPIVFVQWQAFGGRVDIVAVLTLGECDSEWSFILNVRPATDWQLVRSVSPPLGWGSAGIVCSHPVPDFILELQDEQIVPYWNVISYLSPRILH